MEGTLEGRKGKRTEIVDGKRKTEVDDIGLFNLKHTFTY